MGETVKCTLRKRKSTPDTLGSAFASHSSSFHSHLPWALHLACINHVKKMVIHDCHQIRWDGYYFRIDELEQVVDRLYGF
jgi:hypothetical protein